MRVRVYFNLHNRKWSVVNVKTGRVVMHADELRLRGVKWTVQPAGNRKVREQGRKNVHAFATGVLDSLIVSRPPYTGAAHWHRVRYNPYQHTQFHKVYGTPISDEPIETSMFAEFTSGGYAYTTCEGC